MVVVADGKLAFSKDRVVSATQASKNFGECRRRAKREPLFVTDRNASIETVIVDYDEFEPGFIMGGMENVNAALASAHCTDDSLEGFEPAVSRWIWPGCSPWPRCRESPLPSRSRQRTSTASGSIRCSSAAAPGAPWRLCG